MSGGAGGAKKISKKNPTIQSSSRLLLFSIYNSPFPQLKVSISNVNESENKRRKGRMT